ncbi:MAG: winged helix-turn-helix domain-containing protein [Candidatus Nealsonbacteria bacterium]|nr:winged helix-turn-helix domain-containing protein [Candidatus Nealsonbacteria bacterium]
MATATSGACVENIGATAGKIWSALEENGPLSVTKLTQTVAEPRGLVMQGLGWLAREGKINIEEEGRSRVVSLT